MWRSMRNKTRSVLINYTILPCQDTPLADMCLVSCIILYLLGLYLFLPLAKRVKIKENDPETATSRCVSTTYYLIAGILREFPLAEDRRNRSRSLIHLCSSESAASFKMADNERINWLETDGRLFL